MKKYPRQSLLLPVFMPWWWELHIQGPELHPEHFCLMLLGPILSSWVPKIPKPKIFGAQRAKLTFLTPCCVWLWPSQTRNVLSAGSQQSFLTIRLHRLQYRGTVVIYLTTSHGSRFAVWRWRLLPVFNCIFWFCMKNWPCSMGVRFGGQLAATPLNLAGEFIIPKP